MNTQGALLRHAISRTKTERQADQERSRSGKAAAQNWVVKMHARQIKERRQSADKEGQVAR